MILVDVWFNGFMNCHIELEDSWNDLPKCDCRMWYQRYNANGHHACMRGQMLEKLIADHYISLGYKETVTIISAKKISKENYVQKQ